MTLDVTLTFPDASPDTGDLIVRRYELREQLSALFELTVEVLSTHPALDETTVVGQTIVVGFGAEPFLREVRGLVRAVEQRSSVPEGRSLYVWTIVPPLWLTTRRRDCRIFQHRSVPQIAADVLADPTYAGRIPAPDTSAVQSAPEREYVVQYAETDHDFLARLLADEGIASFFDHANGSTWVLTDDTPSAALTLTSEAIPFSDPTHPSPLLAGKPDTAHVQSAIVTTRIETAAVTLRDHDFERPDLRLEAHRATGDAPLESYAFEVGRFSAPAAGDTRAARQLEALRAHERRVRCTTSFALPPGARLSLVDHPRADLGADFLVIRARAVMEGDGRGTHELELIDLARPYRPAHLPKPRIHGTQTAFVVGAEGREIDVDRHGRVLVEFPWDRREQHTGETSRRVRVAHGWAGADRGFVMLPRVKDEVVIAYLDGDPDQPLVVGRVHDGKNLAPGSLPTDEAISVWRSRSTPGGAGFNEILMDDRAGAERLDLHAQRDHKLVVERDVETVVGRHERRTVQGHRAVSVTGNQADAVKGDKTIDVLGDLLLHGKTIEADADETLKLFSGAHMSLTSRSNRNDYTSVNHEIEACAVFVKGREGVLVNAPKIHAYGGEEIHLQVGGSAIHITAGGIEIQSAGDVVVNGAVVKINC